MLKQFFKNDDKLQKSAQFEILNVCRKSMKAENGLKFLTELCFGMNEAKDSCLLDSKVAFLKSGQNAAGIYPFLNEALRHVKDI